VEYGIEIPKLKRKKKVKSNGYNKCCDIELPKPNSQGSSTANRKSASSTVKKPASAGAVKIPHKYKETVWSNSVGQSYKVSDVKDYLSTHGVTQKTLNELFDYDPETGIVTRKMFVNSRAKVGDIAGYKERDGYLRVRIADRNMPLHRVIWAMVYGYFPENHLDHINKIRDDNRLCNLREVTAYCNMRNSSVQKRNKTGVTGICESKRGTWQVTISDFNRPTYIGCFDDFTEAVCHRYAAEQCLSWHECDANSPAYQYLKEQGILK